MAQVIVLSASDRDRIQSKIEQAHKLLASVQEILSSPIVVQTSDDSEPMKDMPNLQGTTRANAYT